MKIQLLLEELFPTRRVFFSLYLYSFLMIHLLPSLINHLYFYCFIRPFYFYNKLFSLDQFYLQNVHLLMLLLYNEQCLELFLNLIPSKHIVLLQITDKILSYNPIKSHLLQYITLLFPHKLQDPKLFLMIQSKKRSSQVDYSISSKQLED